MGKRKMDNKKPDQQEEKKRVKAAESETKAAEKPEGRIEQGYFSYPDVAAAEAAVTEREKIQRLEKQLDYRRPQLVYTLYTKALEGNVFRTAEGYAYLLRLREYLEQNRESLPETIPGLPSDLLQDDTELKETRSRLNEMKDVMRRMRSDLKRLRAGRSITYVVIAFLVVAVIAMLVIAGVSDNPNILNYERVLQDRYAEWEMELNEREAKIREKERSLPAEDAALDAESSETSENHVP